MRRYFLALASTTALFAAALSFGLASQPLTVFAAASLTNALEEIGARYRQKTGHRIQFSFAASSTLARQIEAGAPAEIFASANETWMDYLEAQDMIGADTRISPISNRLVLIAPAQTQLEKVRISAALNLSQMLGETNRLATGDPEHVPAGIYARQALRSLGQWKALESRLARTDNVRAALALVERGEAPLGIVYATDAALSGRVKILGIFPTHTHDPITYPFAIVAGASDQEARRFFKFVTGSPGLAVFEKHGFSPN